MLCYCLQLLVLTCGLEGTFLLVRITDGRDLWLGINFSNSVKSLTGAVVLFPSFLSRLACGIKMGLFLFASQTEGIHHRRKGSASQRHQNFSNAVKYVCMSQELLRYYILFPSVFWSTCGWREAFYLFASQGEGICFQTYHEILKQCKVSKVILKGIMFLIVNLCCYRRAGRFCLWAASPVQCYFELSDDVIFWDVMCVYKVYMYVYNQ